MAGNIKRQNQSESENVVLIRAMRESNIPKFLSEDLPLFSALIQDLFPGVDMNSESYSELDDQVIRSIK
jgi:dynein heavy chain